MCIRLWCTDRYIFCATIAIHWSRGRVIQHIAHPPMKWQKSLELSILGITIRDSIVLEDGLISIWFEKIS